MEVLIDVIGQRMKIATNLREFAPGSQKFIYFKFNLSEDWNGLTVFAQFSQNGQGYNAYLDETNGVYLPSEITKGDCTLMILGNGSQAVKGTSNYIKLRITDNHYIEDANSTEISQSLYDQLIEKVANTEQQIANKVDKKTGSRLMTNAEGEKLAGVEANANNYILPNATDKILGGVKPILKTSDMTAPVGISPEGKLFTKPSSGSGGSSNVLIVDGAVNLQQKTVTPVSNEVWGEMTSAINAGKTVIYKAVCTGTNMVFKTTYLYFIATTYAENILSIPYIIFETATLKDANPMNAVNGNMACRFVMYWGDGEPNKVNINNIEFLDFPAKLKPLKFKHPNESVATISYDGKEQMQLTLPNRHKISGISIGNEPASMLPLSTVGITNKDSNGFDFSLVAATFDTPKEVGFYVNDNLVATMNIYDITLCHARWEGKFLHFTFSIFKGNTFMENKNYFISSINIVNKFDFRLTNSLFQPNSSLECWSVSSKCS